MIFLWAGFDGSRNAGGVGAENDQCELKDAVLIDRASFLTALNGAEFTTTELSRCHFGPEPNPLCFTAIIPHFLRKK